MCGPRMAPESLLDMSAPVAAVPRQPACHGPDSEQRGQTAVHVRFTAPIIIRAVTGGESELAGYSQGLEGCCATVPG